jgi:hypothetical protein
MPKKGSSLSRSGSHSGAPTASASSADGSCQAASGAATQLNARRTSMPVQTPAPGVCAQCSPGAQAPSQRGEAKQPMPSQTCAWPGGAPAQRASAGRLTHAPPPARQALLQSPCSKHAALASSAVAPPSAPHQKYGPPSVGHAALAPPVQLVPSGQPAPPQPSLSKHSVRHSYGCAVRKQPARGKVGRNEQRQHSAALAHSMRISKRISKHTQRHARAEAACCMQLVPGRSAQAALHPLCS